MTNDEAKFILRAYRSDGRDAEDPLFASALGRAASDRAVGQWLEAQRATDAAIADRLEAVAPPRGLREAILIGARASRPSPAWWRQTHWLAAAAALALFAGTFAFTQLRRGRIQDLAQLAHLVVDDLAGHHEQHVPESPAFSALQTRLGLTGVKLSEGPGVTVAELQSHGCRRVTLGDREFFEICFVREGLWYHLYLSPRGDLRAPAGGDRIVTAQEDNFAAAAWVDAQVAYAMVTRSGTAALQRAL